LEIHWTVQGFSELLISFAFYQHFRSFLSSFYRCLNGIAFEAACPAGLFYNPHSAECEALANSRQVS